MKICTPYIDHNLQLLEIARKKEDDMTIYKSLKLWMYFVCILTILLTSCSNSTNNQTLSTPSGEQIQVEPSSTQKLMDTPLPISSPTALPIGISRGNPLPITDLISIPNWEIQVLEIKRGDEAWNDIQAANMFNSAAPEGMEYFLVKLHVKSKYTDSDEHSISGCDFAITGDYLIQYSCSMAIIIAPEPQLNATLYTGGETEGWAGYLVGKGEGNLILVIDEMLDFEDNSIRYVALDEEASIKVSPELASIKPNDLGIDRQNPASITETIITEDWEIFVLEKYRGDEAWNMVQKANQFSEHPAAGMEYIAVKVHARNISTFDKADTIDTSYFKTTGSANVIYDPPFVIEPNPVLNVSLYPGGEYEGWLILQSAIAETGVSIIFESPWDFSGSSKRFIVLE